MNTIKGYCRTNLDGYDCSEVRDFVAVPQKGDRVEVKRGNYPSRLEVCGITHLVKNGIPLIEVELTLKSKV